MLTFLIPLPKDVGIELFVYFGAALFVMLRQLMKYKHVSPVSLLGESCTSFGAA